MPTVSYIKIYGPPVYDAIKELEKIAVDMPEVCIMDTIIDSTPSSYSDSAHVRGYFLAIPMEVTVERCDKIISKSGEKLGEYDFYFEWFTKPIMEQISTLIKKIDKTLKPLGCSYTITTKS